MSVSFEIRPDELSPPTPLSGVREIFSPVKLPLAEIKRITKTLSIQGKTLRKRKILLDQQTSLIQQLNNDFGLICQELSRRGLPLPERKDSFLSDQESDEESLPQFTPIENAFSEQIERLKVDEGFLRQKIMRGITSLSSQQDLDYTITSLIDKYLNDHEANGEFYGGFTSRDPESPKNQTVSEYKWEPISARDDYRSDRCNKSGGLALQDVESQQKLRSVAKEIIRSIGRKILNGDLNLTRISFPIKCMQGNTALHNILKAAMLNPLFLNTAASTGDPVERMKLFIVATIGSFIYTSTFIKPLNPILGETLTASVDDGTILYSEQTLHHPPVSQFLIFGPRNCYKMSGFYNFAASAGLNTVTINNHGNKLIEFPDGHTIRVNCPIEIFTGTFWGEMRHETMGTLSYADSYGNTCDIVIGKTKKRPSDYLEGQIKDAAGKVLSNCTGTYCGYIDFDGVRYWDYRHSEVPAINFLNVLPSDSEVRKDLITLRQGNIEEAQVAKEELEELQRFDRKLRAKFGFGGH